MTQDLSDLVARLRTFDSPTISDACEADVLDAAMTIATHEQQIADKIGDGIPISTVMGREYEELLQPHFSPIRWPMQSGPES